MDFDIQASNKESAPNNVGNNMMVSRQAQEVQAAVIMAKNFPRDQLTAFNAVMESCKRPSLAGQAIYSYPRGGAKIEGPSIRLVEAIAQSWGNVDAGVIELTNTEKSSEMMAYAWDLETNTRITKTFTIKHVRDTKQGQKVLTDSRDVYENKANFSSRRLRACLLGVIPGDVVEAAVEQCKKTLSGAHKEPLKDRIRKMISTFEEEFMISQKQIEEFLGFNIDACDENDYLNMRGTYKSLRDGMAKPEDYFKIKKVKKPTKTNSPLSQTTENDNDLTDDDKAEILAQEAKEAQQESKLPFEE